MNMSIVKRLSPQQELILDHLKCTGSISRYEGMLIHRIVDTPKRISELRQLGYEISDEWRKDHTGKRYKRYFIAEDEVISDEEIINA